MYVLCVVSLCIQAMHSGFAFRLFIQAMHSSYSFRLGIQAIHSGYAFRLFAHAIHSGYSIRLCIQTVHSGRGAGGKAKHFLKNCWKLCQKMRLDALIIFPIH